MDAGWHLIQRWLQVSSHAGRDFPCRIHSSSRGGYRVRYGIRCSERAGYTPSFEGWLQDLNPL